MTATIPSASGGLTFRARALNTRRMRRTRWVAAAALAATLAGCGHSGGGSTDAASSGSTDAANSKQVSRESIPDWPLTVDSGLLRCDGANGVGAVTIEVDGTVYALNGVAKGRGTYSDIAPIWADNPAAAGLKKNIGVMIDEGLKLC